MSYLFIVNTSKTFDAACADLQAAIVNHEFGVMAVHDLGKTLRSKGISFAEKCCLFEVYSSQQTAKALGCDVALNVALPSRISVYTDAGHTRIAMIRPSAILNALSSAPHVFDVAQEVDASTSAMINEAALRIEPNDSSSSQASDSRLDDHSDLNPSSDMDPWELQHLKEQLKEWTFTGQHHIHKSWQFLNAKQALQWHGMARELSDRHRRDCDFFLGHVGSGRIETDIFNRIRGHLTRDDLDVAVMMNAMEQYVKNPSQVPNPHYLREFVQFLHPLETCGDSPVLLEPPPEAEHH